VITLIFRGITFQAPHSLRYGCFLLIFLFTLSPKSGLSDQSFPLYPTIKNNVKFWEKIYSTHSLNDAVIHDSENLSIVYEVVSLLYPELPGARRLNKLTREHTREKYSKILKKIARTRKAVTANEKRIAALFKGPHRFKTMAEAAKNVRSQTGQKERFLQGVSRSRFHIKEMKRIFHNQGLPEDLAYLPHVESSFNTRAYSKFGAAGMWQFTRTTGKQYLTINYTLDERLDPIVATHAAARYLKNSYRLLGNWPLAITSYNYGTSGMLRAVKAQKSYENIFINYNQGHFKFASKNFYAEFLAALKVAKELEKKSKTTQQPVPSVRYLKLPGYIHINHIEKHFRLGQEKIRKLNPALRPPVLTGEKLIPKGYSLRLPDSKENNQRIRSIPSSFYAATQKRSKFHRVKKGETAGSIALLYGVSIKNLRMANNLDQFATIYIRQKLKIPFSSAIAPTKEEVLKLRRQNTKQIPKNKDSFIPLLTANKKNRPSTGHDITIPQKDPTLYNVFSVFTKDKKQYGYITVQPEESLGLYAQWLGTTVKKTLRLNNLSTYSAIEPGQKLLLNFDNRSTEHFEEKRLDYLREIVEDFFSAYIVIGQKTYQINRGDTFWDLCYNKFDIPMWLLKRYNASLDLSKLSSSQQLTIPILKAI